MDPVSKMELMPFLGCRYSKPCNFRTNKMEDIIFAGTEKLSQKGFAEVNLNFKVDADKFNFR